MRWQIHSGRQDELKQRRSEKTGNYGRVIISPAASLLEEGDALNSCYKNAQRQKAVSDFGGSCLTGQPGRKSNVCAT